MEKAELYDGKDLVLKAYLSPDRRTVRIVLPDLRGYGQVRHFVDGPVKYLQFKRDSKQKYKK